MSQGRAADRRKYHRISTDQVISFAPVETRDLLGEVVFSRLRTAFRMFRQDPASSEENRAAFAHLRDASTLDAPM